VRSCGFSTPCLCPCRGAATATGSISSRAYHVQRKDSIASIEAIDTTRQDTACGILYLPITQYGPYLAKIPVHGRYRWMEACDLPSPGGQAYHIIANGSRVRF